MKKRKGLKIVTIVLSSIVCLFVLIGFINFFINLYLRSYINSFSKVEYDNRLNPTMDTVNDHYQFTTDDDFKVVNITDIHLGGGFLSVKKDKKAILEVITILQNEKPDLVILDGDNIFAIPYISGTINNKMVSKTILNIFEHEEVYFTTVFGNHDTEVFDYTNRKNLGKLYSKDKYKYCLFRSEFDGYGITNQIIEIKDSNNNIKKALVMIDSNAYVDNSISAVLNWDYDTIHDNQVNWAKNELEKLNTKALVFMHIPTSEFEIAYRHLKDNNPDTVYVSGIYDELEDEVLDNGRIWFGGCQNKQYETLGTEDKLFEELTSINALDGIFVGHDHVNNAVVIYKDVMLSYGYSIDNLAYDDIDKYGLQRGSTIITIHNDKTFTQVHKNLYTSNYVFEKEYNELIMEPYYENPYSK